MFIQLLSAQDFELLVYLLDRTYQEIKLLRHQHRFDDFISTVLSVMDRAAPAIERRPGRKKILRVSNKRCPNSDPGLFYEVCSIYKIYVSNWMREEFVGTSNIIQKHFFFSNCFTILFLSCWKLLNFLFNIIILYSITWKWSNREIIKIYNRQATTALYV